MTNSGNHPKAKASRMDTLLEALDCLGKLLQIVKTGFFLLKHV